MFNRCVLRSRVIIHSRGGNNNSVPSLFLTKIPERILKSLPCQCRKDIYHHPDPDRARGALWMDVVQKLVWCGTEVNLVTELGSSERRAI